MSELNDAINMFDWQIDVLIGVLAAFVAILTLRFLAWLVPSRSWFAVSGRRVVMPRDPPEVLGQRMADAIVDWAEDLVYRKVVSREACLFMYRLLANVLGERDYLPKGEKLLRERLDKMLAPSVSEEVSSALSTLKVKRG